MSTVTRRIRLGPLVSSITLRGPAALAKQAVTIESNSSPYTAAVVIYAVLLISMQLLSTSLERRRFKTA